MELDRARSRGGVVMTSIEELRTTLADVAKIKDIEQRHIVADDLLIEFINDPVVTEIWKGMMKWYS
jgi:hypothetical protein